MSTSSSFCTMGGMAASHSSVYHITTPVILPDDDDHKNNNDGDTHVHGMDDNSSHEDHSSHHSMSNMNMGGMTMYMDGFHSALFSETPPPCLNLFHPSWTLHTESKFMFAMVCITLMGMLVEACGVWRVKCLRKGRSCRRDVRMRQDADMQGQQLEFRRQSLLPRGMQRTVSDISNVSAHEATMHPPPSTICPAVIRRMWRAIVPKVIRNICGRICCCLNTNDSTKLARQYDNAAALLHATRAALGYLLMLAVMSYAIEFLICTVVGLVLGRYWFIDGSGDNAAAAGIINGAVGVGGGIGGMGLGDGGRQTSGQGVGMTDVYSGGGNDGTWGGGGDPCCGIDDDDEDGNSNHDDVVGNSLRDGSLQEPLLGVTRRSGSAV